MSGSLSVLSLGKLWLILLQAVSFLIMVLSDVTSVRRAGSLHETNKLVRSMLLHSSDAAD